MRGLFFAFLKILTIIALIAIVAASVTGLIFAIYIDRNVEKEIDETLFSGVGAEAATKLYYYDFTDRENRIGELKELTEDELYGGYRVKYKGLKNIPEDMIDAFISIEDKRFYSHSGVDWKRTVSAALNYFLKFSDSYGGSTITQQLIKNVTEKDE